MAILIVDDDELNRKILEEILEDASYVTISAEDGVQAMEQMKANAADIELVLLDRMMPNMDGMQVMEEMKKHDNLQGIPVIMQTAASAPKDVIEGAGTGVYYYLTKPYDEQIVLSIVRAALDEAKK
mgnify:CR=1 FL=1